MKLFLQALQTVTVEALGVLFIVWMLFGFASWSLRSTGGSQILKQPVTAAKTVPVVRTRLEQARLDQQRTAYVARQLDRYGRMLDTASKQMWRRTWANLEM